MKSGLSPTQRDYVISELADAMAKAPHPRVWLRGLAFDGNILIELQTDLNEPLKWAEEALRLAERRGARRHPPWLVTLLQALVETEQLVEIIDSVSNEPPPPSPDPFASRWLGNGMPFLDRTTLRDGVHFTAGANDRNVLVVNGPNNSGKSYTAEFIDHLSRELVNAAPMDDLPAFRVARLPLEPGYGPTYTPVRLARDLVSRMGGNAEPPAGDLGDPHWVDDLVSFILIQAKQTEHVWWWIFDGFCAEDLHPDSRRLIHKLARRVSEGEESRRGRVALLDYNDPIPGILPAKLQPETLGEPVSIGAEDVRDYYNELSETLPEPLPPERIEDLVNNALEDLPTDETRLPELSARLLEVTNGLRQRRI